MFDANVNILLLIHERWDLLSIRIWHNTKCANWFPPSLLPLQSPFTIAPWAGKTAVSARTQTQSTGVCGVPNRGRVCTRSCAIRTSKGPRILTARSAPTLRSPTWVVTLPSSLYVDLLNWRQYVLKRPWGKAATLVIGLLIGPLNWSLRFLPTEEMCLLEGMLSWSAAHRDWINSFFAHLIVGVILSLTKIVEGNKTEVMTTRTQQPDWYKVITACVFWLEVFIGYVGCTTMLVQSEISQLWIALTFLLPHAWIQWVFF